MKRICSLMLCLFLLGGMTPIMAEDDASAPENQPDTTDVTHSSSDEATLLQEASVAAPRAMGAEMYVTINPSSGGYTQIILVPQGGALSTESHQKLESLGYKFNNQNQYNKTVNYNVNDVFSDLTYANGLQVPEFTVSVTAYEHSADEVVPVYVQVTRRDSNGNVEDMDYIEIGKTSYTAESYPLDGIKEILENHYGEGYEISGIADSYGVQNNITTGSAEYIIYAEAKAIDEEPTEPSNQMGVEINASDADGKTIRVGETFDMSVTTTGKVDGVVMVKGTASGLSADDFYVEYYEPNGEQAGQWLPLVGDSFGPQSGFPFVVGATSNFRVKALKEGDYDITINIVDATDTSKVYASDTLSFTVVGENDPLPDDQMGVEISAPAVDGKTIRVNDEPFEMSVTTTGNVSSVIMVKGTATGLDADDFYVEYYEPNGEQAGQWLPLVGDSFGPQDGFQFVVGATSRFRVKALKEGEYDITINIVDANDTSKVYASDTLSFTVIGENDPMPQPEEKPQSSTGTTTKNVVSTWDNGGPFTTDSCGSVYDRWGNLIWQGTCTVNGQTTGFQLVNTADR